MFRHVVFGYCLTATLVLLGSFLYAIGFVENYIVPKTLDLGPRLPWDQALWTDGLLLLVFLLAHSAVARPAWRWMATVGVPAAMARSTALLASGGVLALLFWQWEPVGGIVWFVYEHQPHMALHAVAACGWLTVLGSSGVIHRRDLFGLRQAYLYLRGRDGTAPGATFPDWDRWSQLARRARYLGWLLAFWGTPTMTAARLALAMAATLYVVVALWFGKHARHTPVAAPHGVATGGAGGRLTGA